MDDHVANREKNTDSTNRPIKPIQHGPPSEVNFTGLITSDAPLKDTSTPVAYRSHPLLENSFFYTIPQQILEAVCVPQTGESSKADDKKLQMELELSQISGDHGSRIGFWNNRPIECNLMHAIPLRREDLSIFDHLSEEQKSEFLRVANNQLLSFSEISCGYAGWLMTNQEYLSELKALFQTFAPQFERWGTAMVGLPIPSSQPPGPFNPTSEKGWQDFDSAVLEFCVRWRLQGLAGPRIPIPMRPMMSGQFPLSIVEQLMRAGGVFNWPDTFPLFARDELRDLLANALQPSKSSDHLAEWQAIIDSSNKAKNQISTFERRFRLQHFWILLRERHPKAFKKRINHIERAFAKYLGVKVSTIQLDRKKISKSLGKSWG